MDRGGGTPSHRKDASMKKSRVGMIAVFVALLFAFPYDQPCADACGWSSSVETVTSEHPDVPLRNFASGRLGIIRPTYARSYLVVAYRHLEGIGLNAAERAGAEALWNARLGMGNPAGSPESPWLATKSSVLGTSTRGPIQTSVSRHYAQINNCLPDAFRKAAATLDARAKQFGAKDATVRAWVERQDAVFANCGGTKQPVPMPGSSAPPLVRADAAYQQAAAAFYAGDYIESERLFRNISRDASSPWRYLAKYVTARAITRDAFLSGPTPSRPSLLRAEGELRSLLADPAAREMHGPAKQYLQFLRFRTAPEALQRELSVSLASARLDHAFQSALDDFTSLLDRNLAPMSLTAPTNDRLSAWLGVVQSSDASAFDRAESLYNKTKSPVWLVAALMKATPAHGARIDPLVRAAATLPASHPGYASAHYHRIRLLAARHATPALFAETKTMLGTLRPEDGRSTRNALLELAVRLAPTLDDLLDHATAVPAGVYDDGGFGLVQPPENATPQLHPAAADLISSKLPVSLLAAAAKSPKLPNEIRAQVAVAAWVRAVILNDRGTEKSIAPVVSTLNPAIRPYVEKVSASKTRPQRRLALLAALLEAPASSPSVFAWRKGSVTTGTISSSYDSNWWCGLAAAGGNAGTTWQTPGNVPSYDVRFLSRAQRQARDGQVRRLNRLGSAPTFLANESADVAKLLPNDPKLPELLHLAVRATRYGCKDAGTTPASRRAFRTLHSKYPNSDWTKKTPYYY
jgi:hypothetical protein